MAKIAPPVAAPSLPAPINFTAVTQFLTRILFKKLPKTSHSTNLPLKNIIYRGNYLLPYIFVKPAPIAIIPITARVLTNSIPTLLVVLTKMLLSLLVKSQMLNFSVKPIL